ncbi:hypothetical protein O181_014604 [Austropuccinia psidii MF-1]|uniref:Reverse transcriptase Ty1/copia-type domain-containing protein n=1 Tax=Austropuccinia psidii MF-1 TaxID=1389203 RepID=A0A9Q3C0E0_9BASI|nr:hypothetical protein [Austropuccinia psidii MF-1]
MVNLKFWEVTKLEDNHKLIGTTWVFKTKQNPLYDKKEYKACLCTQGFTQLPGIDFKKNYAPTGRLNSLQTLFVFAATNNLQFHQLDVKSAFLNAPLTEDVYLSIPQGLNICQQSHCLNLRKALYGLRQAPLAWYDFLKEWLTSVAFQFCIPDPCVFFRSNELSTWIYLHVDNMGVFDLGEASLMIGIKITQDEGLISLDQQHFMESLLEQYGMMDCRPFPTPLVTIEHLLLATSDEVTKLKSLKINFRSAIGSIKYISSSTRPDLSFEVSTLSNTLNDRAYGTGMPSCMYYTILKAHRIWGSTTLQTFPKG